MGGSSGGCGITERIYYIASELQVRFDVCFHAARRVYILGPNANR